MERGGGEGDRVVSVGSARSGACQRSRVPDGEALPGLHELPDPRHQNLQLHAVQQRQLLRPVLLRQRLLCVTNAPRPPR
eukprot:744812-Hanusia_phi.AAC.1